MNKHGQNLFLIAMAGLLAGCGGADRYVTGGPGSEDAAINMETSKREYENCARYETPGQPTCAGLKALYQRDLKAYQDSLKSPAGAVGR